MEPGSEDGRQKKATKQSKFFRVVRLFKMLAVSAAERAGPGHYDGKFDAAPDIDHGNKKVLLSRAVEHTSPAKAA